MPNPLKLSINQQDQFLELVLPAQSDLEYQRALVAFGNQVNRSASWALEEMENWLRRRSNCRSVYCGPVDETSRQNRVGLPFSYTEQKIFYWSENWQGESKTEPTPGYLANLMQRPVSEIDAELDLRRNTKSGLERLF